MNPYEVLGVRETASDEEIRKAYLELVKKYHPDRFTDASAKELANEKLTRINEAYDMLTRNKKGGQGNSSGSYQYGRTDGDSYSGGYSGENAAQYMRVRQLLNSGNINAAAEILKGIQVRNAEWHFLAGVVKLRRGSYDGAREEMRQATQMDPNNVEYRNAYTALNNSYRGYGRPAYQPDRGPDMCQVCQTLYCMDCCCESMGGDFIRCC